MLTNLLENADHHGGGPVRIRIEATDGPFRVPSRTPAQASPQRAREDLRALRPRHAARHRVGTGLGLALVSEHAVAHGGEAWVEDRPGGGARFVVRLPRAVGR